MVMSDLLSIVKQLEDCTDTVKRIFHMAPGIVPDQLYPFVFLPREKVKESLTAALSIAEDKDAFLNGIQELVNIFNSMVKDMDTRIAERQQPTDIPRREGYKQINQFKKRRSEW
jgi:hypothetical protein